MHSNLYKFTVCLVIALCAVESYNYVFNNVLPEPHIAFLGMFLTCLLLAERLYIILWLEHHGMKKK
jgi:hypothetical protein